MVGDDCINGFFLMLKSVCFFLEHRVVKLRWDFCVFIRISTKDVETIIFRQKKNIVKNYYKSCEIQVIRLEIY